MNKQITQLKLFWNFEKEEAWLEHMAETGWFLTNVTLCLYTFVQGTPEKGVYKIDTREFKDKSDRDDYMALFTDSGWTCAASVKSANTYYFYAKKEYPGKDIFSDKASKAQRYLRFANNISYSLIPLIPICVSMYSSNALRFENVGYQTPGLWSMTGGRFIFHFLFETPFVALRLIGGVLPILMVLVCLGFMGFYYRAYRKALTGEK